MQYDIIGDIHGHADKLENLLINIGYTLKNGIYQQDGHQAVFVGDYIDRGEQNRRTLEIVRNMVEFGNAHAVMGNHEYNAVCYHTLRTGSKTDYLRPHTHSKFRQHEAFLKEYPLGHEDTKDIIKWFKSLPLFLEFKHFRVVHACWDKAVIKHLRKKYLNKKNNSLKNQFWPESADSANKPPLFNYIERILKGEEVSLPKDISLKDKDGNKRETVRIKWWGDKSGMCRDVAFGYDHQTITNFPSVKPTIPEDSPIYPETAKPVFFGHYWQTGIPRLQQNNLCCLDYSAGRGGNLVCYQFRNPSDIAHELNERNLVC